MSETARPHPTEAQRFVAAMKQLVSVSKPEILRLEREAKAQRKAKRNGGAGK